MLNNWCEDLPQQQNNSWLFSLEQVKITKHWIKDVFFMVCRGDFILAAS